MKKPSDLLQIAMEKGIQQCELSFYFVQDHDMMSALAAIYAMQTGVTPWHWNGWTTSMHDPQFREKEMLKAGIDMTTPTFYQRGEEWTLFNWIMFLDGCALPFDVIIACLQQVGY